MENIQESNRLIAEFMGVPKCDRCRDIPECGGYKFGGGNYYLPSQMKYHTSWDWLMQVYEKVSNVFQNYKELTNRKGKFRDMEPLYRKLQEEIIHVNIKGAHEWLVQFITWFNTQTPTT